MQSALITDDVWRTLTHAAKRSKRPCFVAVAYFGKGASKLLPLKPESHLVVDASDAAVKSGQTDPQELRVMLKRGVNVFSYRMLHAKVFAFDQVGFIGSANASANSAANLREAIWAVPNRHLSKIRQFVGQLCLEPLGPKELRRLQKLYRPPKFVPVLTKPGRRIEGTTLRVVHTRSVELSTKLSAAFDAGEIAASKKRTRRRGFEIGSFYWSRSGRFPRGQVLVEIWRDGRRLEVSPPGHVIYTKRFRSERERKLLVFYELEKKDWKSFREIDRSTQALLKRGGLKGPVASRTILGAIR